MSSIDQKLNDSLHREDEDSEEGLSPEAESVDVQGNAQSDEAIEGSLADSTAVGETAITESAEADVNEETEVVTATDDDVSPINATSSTSPSPPSTPTTTTAAPLVPPPDAQAQETETQPSTSTTSTTSTTPFIGPVLGPVVSMYSPYIEDQRVPTPGPNVFEKNIRNAIESRNHEEKHCNDEQKENMGSTSSAVETQSRTNDSVAPATPSNGCAPETESDDINEQNDESVEEHGETKEEVEPTEVLPETNGNKDGESATSVQGHATMNTLEVSAGLRCTNDQGEVLQVVESCTIDTPDASVAEAQSNTEQEGTSKEASDSIKELQVSADSQAIKEYAEDQVVEPCTKEQPHASVGAHCEEPTESTENIVEVKESQGVQADTGNSAAPEMQPADAETIAAPETQPTDAETIAAPETQPADAETIAQAKEWHDSIIRRVARLRGLSCWLGERNKRMDGMVEILVRSLEHMGVGAVTDHIGNLIPLQNFRLKSAIKLSPTNNTWTTCDEEIMSNDINAWLPDSFPDDHNLPLTNEQMTKYEIQVEALRAENESLQRSLQAALDNQGSLGVQVNQWQACIDSAGQQLCRVTQEVHESKSRERHLRHLLGEERRIKESLMQQNSVTNAEQHDRTTDNENWQQQNSDGGSDPSHSAISVNNDGATFAQGTSMDRQHMLNDVAPAAKAPPTIERPWQHRRGVSYEPRDTRSSRLNSSAPPFISAYSSPRRSSNRGNWRSGSDWHSRSGYGGRHFGSAGGRGRHNGGRGYYRKEHSPNAGFNRLLDGFFDNLNRIENALRQQGISVPGPTSDSSQAVQQQQQQQQTVSNNVNMQYQTVQDLQQPQIVPNQPIYYSPPVQQPVVYAEPENTVAQPVQSIPSMQQVPQRPNVVQAAQPHVQFVQVEGQAY